MSNCLDGVPEEMLQAVKASEDKTAFVRDLKAENARKRSLMKQTKAKHEEAMQIIDSHPKGKRSGLNSMLSGDIYKQAKNSNVEYRTSAIIGQAHQKFVDVIEALSTRKLGFTHDKAMADDVVRELFEASTGNANAKKLAGQFTEMSEWLRTRFNNAGGAIGKLENWGMPQSHNQVAVSRATPEEWKNFIIPLLKNDSDLDLDKVYETIATGGLNKAMKTLDPTKPRLGGGKMMANKHNDPRVLQFKDAESWLKYQKEFGENDPLSVMLDHVRKMSNDIALLEILGPNPDNMFKTLLKEVEADDLLGAGKKRSISSKILENDPQKLYNVVSGKVDSSGAQSMLAKGAEEIIGTMRGMQTASKLGSAQLSAVTDLGTLAVNTKYHGMSLGKMLKNMATKLDVSKQVEATRTIGLAADVFNSTLSSRYAETAKGWTNKTAEAVIRAQGMNIWTEAARKAFQTEFYSHLANLKATKKGVPEIFAEYGWKKAEYNKLDFDNLNVQQQTRILEMINQESDYAVMMPTARTRAFTTMGAEKGTVTGEVSRMATQFKSFPITFMIQQMSRTFFQRSTKTRAAYGASLLTATTILGGIAVMAKDAAKGYTPRDGSPLSDNQDFEDQAKFWTASITQGGGLGILGDYLFSDQNRFGGSAPVTLLGPIGGSLESAGKLTVGNVQQAIQGKDTHAGSELVDFVNREANPLNLWYTKALMDRYVYDNIKSFLDDNYEKDKARRERKRRKEYGQEKYDFLQD